MAPSSLEQVRRGNFGRLASVLGIEFQDRVGKKLAQLGFDDLRLSHNAVLMNLDAKGTRHTVLASRARVTRQAIGQLVDDLEALGYVKRKIDPSDRRAQLVCFSDRGQRLMGEAGEVIRATEREFAAILGAPRLKQVTLALAELVNALEIDLPH